MTRGIQIGRTVVGIAAVLIWLCSVRGQPPEETETVFSGQLTDLDIDRMTMTVQALPLTKIFGIAPDCEVVTKTKPQASLEDLQIGDEIDVTYQDIDGVLIAHRIVQRSGAESNVPFSLALPTAFRYLSFRSPFRGGPSLPEFRSAF